MVINPLDRLAEIHGTDKGTGPHDHQYTSIYYELFRGREASIRKVLEVGVYMGASLKMWRDYFPNAHIYGMEINDYPALVDPRITWFMLDATRETQVTSAMAKAGADFDLIVDDASHLPEHQIATALLLMPYLARDGLYVIEDVGLHPLYVIQEMVAAFAEFDLNVLQDRWPDSRLFLLRHRNP